MDYVRKFDIELEKEHYYAGEKLKGWVIVENLENLKVRGVRVFLRGKAHVEWKVTRGGERRTVKEDQYFMDEKVIVWGKDKNDEGCIPIMPRGDHKFPFDFQLPESALPCSFESKIGTIRYYLRVIIDIPYASPPQGLKYFTIIGPHIDCMDERYLAPVSYVEQSKRCCLCCTVGPVSLEATLERSAYCCGERIKLKSEIQNGSDQNVWIVCRLIQHVEFHINKGVLGLTKEVSHKVWEFKGPTVAPHSTASFHDLHRHLQVPVMPPTLADVCKLIELYYVLRVSLGLEKSGEDLEMDFPLDVATVPFRIPNAQGPTLAYEMAAEHVEGGLYISPEFQLGQVYDGTLEQDEDIILYRPVYVCLPHEKLGVSNMNNAHASSSSSIERERRSPQALVNRSPRASGASSSPGHPERSPMIPLNKGGRSPGLSPHSIKSGQQQQQQHPAPPSAIGVMSQNHTKKTGGSPCASPNDQSPGSAAASGSHSPASRGSQSPQRPRNLEFKGKAKAPASEPNVRQRDHSTADKEILGATSRGNDMGGREVKQDNVVRGAVHQTSTEMKTVQTEKKESNVSSKKEVISHKEITMETKTVSNVVESHSGSQTTSGKTQTLNDVKEPGSSSKTTEKKSNEVLVYTNDSKCREIVTHESCVEQRIHDGVKETNVVCETVTTSQVCVGTGGSKEASVDQTSTV